MPYLNLDIGYFSHRKTKRLVSLLGRGAEILPLRLWCHCGEHHAEDGRFTDESPKEIETIANWWGKPGVMVKAMVRVVFLEKDSRGYFCHDWVEHEGHIVKFKLRAIEANRIRWAKEDDPTRNPCRNPKDPPKESSNLTNQPNQPTEGDARAREGAQRPHGANGSDGGPLSPHLRIGKEKELERIEAELKSLTEGRSFADLSLVKQGRVKFLRENRDVIRKVLGVAA